MRRKTTLASLLLLIISGFQLPLVHASEDSSVVGPQQTIVILAKFPGIENEHTPAYIDNLVFGEVNDFFRESSYGQLWLTGTTTSTWYELPHTLDYYWEENLPYSPDQGIIRDTFNLVSSEVDFNNYDRVLLIYPEASRKRGYTLWSPIAKIGVAIESRHTWMHLAHELTHVLGYCTPRTLYLAPPDWPVGWEEEWGYGSWLYLSDLYNNIRDWGLMGGAPAHHLAWTKIRLGWIPPSRVLTVNLGEIATTWVDPLEINTDNIQVIKIPVFDIYYLLVEARQKIGFNENIIPGVIVSFGRDYGYFEGDWEFSVDKMPKTIFSLAPSHEEEEWYLVLNADERTADGNWMKAQADVYIDGKYTGKVWEVISDGPFKGELRAIWRRMVGAHVLSMSENDNYGTLFSSYSRGTAGKSTRPVGPSSPGFISWDSQRQMDVYYADPEYTEEYKYGPLFIIGYYAFQEGDRISFPDLNLSITVLEEENGSYRIRVGPAPLIQHNDAGSGSDAGGRDSPLEIQLGSYWGYLGASSADYRDFYKIDMVQGQEINASMTPLANGKTWIRLYDSENYDIGAPDSGWVADGGENHRISYTAPLTGPLYLGVFRSSGMGEYRLDISLSAIPTALTSPSPSFDLQLGESKTITATLTRLDDVPLADRSVSWYTTAGDIAPLSGATDNQGQVSATYTASTLRPKVTIIASFGGSDNYENGSCQFEVMLSTGVNPENLISDAWQMIENVKAQTQEVVEIENGDLNRIAISSSRDLDNMELRIQQLTAPPSWVTPSSKMVHSYFYVLSTVAADDVENTLLEFRVDKSWIAEHGIDSRSVVLSKYENGEWWELPTWLIRGDDSYFYYSASSPSLSVFVVTGEQAFPLTLLIVAFVLIVVIALATVYWFRFRR